MLPALANFPTTDANADAIRINHLIEQSIQTAAPEQYLWVHKRFKARGPSYPEVYSAMSFPDQGSVRILVIRYRFIGDTVLAIPFLRNLRAASPRGD